MAYAASNLVKTVYGNQRIHHIRVTADATSGAVDTGLSVVEFFQVCGQSATTTGFRTFMNQNSGLTANNGSVAISGAVSGDTIMLTVFGR